MLFLLIQTSLHTAFSFKTSATARATQTNASRRGFWAIQVNVILVKRGEERERKEREKKEKRKEEERREKGGERSESTAMHCTSFV